MAFQLSPGVNVSEIDLTTIVPAVGTTEGAFVGNFAWGPVNQIVSLSNELELVDIFGKPTANNFESFFTAANFLSYARSLRVVRAGSNTSALNATANGGVGLSISNRDIYESLYLDLSAANTFGMYAARYPGDLGNSLRVSLWASPNTASYPSWAYREEFQGVPGTSTYTAGVNGANDEMHIIVIDEDGRFTGTSNTVLEKFGYVSKASDAKNDDGSSNYYVNVINERSKYIYILEHALNASGVPNTTTWGATANGTAFAQGLNEYTNSLSSGSYVTPTDSNLITGYDRFANADEVDVSLVLTGPHSANVVSHVIDNIVSVRKDCVAFVSPPRASVVNNSGNETTAITTYRNSTLNKSSSYAVMDTGWKYQFDKYNNVYRWVPLNGDIAGLCVRTDFERDPWFSPAGFNRGQIKNVIKLAWNPNKSQRDDLYKIGVNPVVSFPGEGTVLYGDKTLLAKPSAFDRINVRRLFIVLEKAIARAAKYSLFEFNDEFTRAQFVALVEPYLRDVKGRRGIFDFRVVCDETNNTPEVIDRNEFVGDIYIKPARSINFIQLNFVAVRTGVAFEEVVGRF
jgi:phage tail sheath protein FI